ncbi:hypothetical protein T492DRAFT_894601, partial [Pavlovales sp. CCMP2436]
MWGWTGRNTPVSLAALQAQTVSDRAHELRVLERMALRVDAGAPNDEARSVMRDQGQRELATAKLADYKEMADQDMYKGFEAFLTGDWARTYGTPLCAHGYLEREYRKKKEFDIYIGSLYALGPQTMDQAWHYYKFIVKQQRPTDRELDELQPSRPGADDRSDWK